MVTPDELIDFMESKQAHMTRMTYLVMDERVLLLNVSSQPKIRVICEAIRSQSRIHVLNASWPDSAWHYAADFLDRDAQGNVGFLAIRWQAYFAAVCQDSVVFLSANVAPKGIDLNEIKRFCHPNFSKDYG